MKGRIEELIEIVDVAMDTGKTEALEHVWRFLKAIQREWEVDCVQCNQRMYLVLSQKTLDLIVI